MKDIKWEDVNCTVTVHAHDVRLIPVTHADRIRSMTDEELAVLFTADEYDGAKCFSCPVPHPCPHESEADCRDCWIDWLKQEATDD